MRAKNNKKSQDIVQLSFRIEAELHKQFHILCVQKGVSQQDTISKLIEKFVEKNS